MTDRSKWLEERKRYITASDAAAVLGKNPYKKPLEVYLDKLGLIPPFEGNAHTRRGVENEPAIIKAFANSNKKFKNVTSNSALVTSSAYPFLAATPDGFLDYCGKRATLEVKCPARVWSSPPEYYVLQVWAQMLVSGVDVGFLAWSCAPVGDGVSHIKYDLAGMYPECGSMYLKTLEFFHSCVLEQDLHPSFW